MEADIVSTRKKEKKQKSPIYFTTCNDQFNWLELLFVKKKGKKETGHRKWEQVVSQETVNKYGDNSQSSGLQWFPKPIVSRITSVFCRIDFIENVVALNFGAHFKLKACIDTMNCKEPKRGPNYRIGEQHAFLKSSITFHIWSVNLFTQGQHEHPRSEG